MTTTTGGTGAGDLVAAALDASPPLADRFRDMLTPIQQYGEVIREHYASQGAIYTLEQDPALYYPGAVDGAFVNTPWSIGDHLATLVVGVQTTAGGEMEVVRHRSWTDFHTHDAGSEALVTAVMMCHELLTVPDLVGPGRLTVIDGSHLTSLVAVNTALASPHERVRRTVLDLAENEGLIEAVETIARTGTVIACPKANSAADIWRECAPQLGLPGDGFPDKVLASLILHPGEVLMSTRSAPDWGRLHVAQNMVSDSGVKTFAERLALAANTLREPGVQVYHVKPQGGDFAIRAEIKPVDGDFATDAMLNSLTQDCCPPHTQEPVVQYVADLLAKQVSSLADVQIGQARNELAESGDTEFLNYLMQHYRTF